VQKFQTLAEYLGTSQQPADEPQPRLEDIAGDAEAFCKAVLNSYEFRQYIVNGLVLGSVPAAVMLRVMDMAGWQKPPERVEHSGRVDSVTEVRRVVIHKYIEAAEEDTQLVSRLTH
jgi:hypothetical protein